MIKCIDCKKVIDTDNDTFVMERVEDSYEHICFNCFKKRKSK